MLKLYRKLDLSQSKNQLFNDSFKSVPRCWKVIAFRRHITQMTLLTIAIIATFASYLAVVVKLTFVVIIRLTLTVPITLAG